jgi:hypothetical protein
MMILYAILIAVIQALQVGASFLNGMAGTFGGIILLVLGALIILVLVAAALVMLPAILVAALIWFITGSFFLAGIAFLAVAVISIFAMADD